MADTTSPYPSSGSDGSAFTLALSLLHQFACPRGTERSPVVHNFLPYYEGRALCHGSAKVRFSSYIYIRHQGQVDPVEAEWHIKYLRVDGSIPGATVLCQRAKQYWRADMDGQQ